MKATLENLEMGDEHVHMLSTGELRIVRIPGGFLCNTIHRFYRNGVTEQAVSSCFVPEGAVSSNCVETGIELEEVEAARGK